MDLPSYNAYKISLCLEISSERFMFIYLITKYKCAISQINVLQINEKIKFLYFELQFAQQPSYKKSVFADRIMLFVF